MKSDSKLYQVRHMLCRPSSLDQTGSAFGKFVVEPKFYIVLVETVLFAIVFFNVGSQRINDCENVLSWEKVPVEKFM